MSRATWRPAPTVRLVAMWATAVGANAVFELSTRAQPAPVTGHADDGEQSSPAEPGDEVVCFSLVLPWPVADTPASDAQPVPDDNA